VDSTWSSCPSVKADSTERERNQPIKATKTKKISPYQRTNLRANGVRPGLLVLIDELVAQAPDRHDELRM
jgi:hypothetical protein